MTKKLSPQTLSAIFLVCGTCIGGGMLALPVATAPFGFIPSTVVMIASWIAMTLTALYLVEVGFWMKKDDAHLISMAETFLGPAGKAVSWFLYLFICYGSVVAYTAGAGSLLEKASSSLFDISLSKEFASFIFIAVFGPVIFCSHRALGRLNTILFIAMVAAFFALITVSLPHVETRNLLRYDFNGTWLTLPLLLTAFSFQTIVPSLHPYLQHHAPSLKVAIWGGTLLALVVYLVWQMAVLGTVPLEGANGLQEVFKEGGVATHVLGAATNSHFVELLASFFAFFAFVTSFLGLSLGLYDFLADGLSIKKKGTGNITLGLLIIVPTYIAAISFERIFVAALDATGGFGDSILNGMIPVLMIVLGRYFIKHKKTAFRAPGGKVLLIAAFCFYALALTIEILSQVGYFIPIHTLD